MMASDMFVAAWKPSNSLLIFVLTLILLVDNYLISQNSFTQTNVSLKDLKSQTQLFCMPFDILSVFSVFSQHLSILQFETFSRQESGLNATRNTIPLAKIHALLPNTHTLAILTKINLKYLTCCSRLSTPWNSQHKWVLTIYTFLLKSNAVKKRRG